MEDKLIYARDIHDGEFEPLFNSIKEQNEILYHLLMAGLEKNPSVGLRADVLSYFAEKAESLGSDQKLLFQLTDFACNPRVNVSYLSFVDDYFNHNTSGERFSIDDFGVVFSACVEKSIPIETVRNMFYGNMDVVEIYEAVDKYEESLGDTGNNAEDISYEKNVQVIDEPKHSEVSAGSVKDDFEEPVKVVRNEDNASDVDMFNNLVTVMTFRDKEGMEALGSLQGRFTDILSVFNSTASDLSSFSAELFNSMKKDKEEIKKLNAMISIIQKLLTQKQNEINSLRGEVARLNERIRASEKAELKRNQLYEKITEAYKMTADNADGIIDGHFSLNG